MNREPLTLTYISRSRIRCRCGNGHEWEELLRRSLVGGPLLCAGCQREGAGDCEGVPLEPQPT